MSLKINILLLVSFFLIALLSVVKTTSTITHITQKNAIDKAGLISSMAEKARNFNITSVETHASASTDVIIEQAIDNQFSCTYFKTQNLSALFSINECNVKYAALSPMNTANKANDFEKSIITAFSNKQQNSSSSGIKTMGNRKMVYLAKPIVYQEPCMSCHMASTGESGDQKAGATEDQGHYYMKLGMPAGAFFTYVPYEKVRGATSHQITVSTIKIILPILFVFITLKVLVFIFIERPLLRLTKLSDAISRGEKLNKKIIKNGTDEISDLFIALNRTRRSTKKLLKLAKKG